MSNKEGFVSIQNYVERGTSWDREEAEEAPVQKSGNVWGKVAEAAKPVSLAQVQEEEKKRELAEKEKKQQEDRQPSGTYKPKRFGDDNSWGVGGGAPRPSYGAPGVGSVGGFSNQREERREFQPRERERHPIPDRPPFTAYIGNLPYDKASEEDLAEYFGELGVSDIRIVRDNATGRPKGYAYIEFSDREGLENALAADGTEFGSRKLLVDVASTKDSRGGGDREEDRSRWGPRDGAGSASGFGRRENREPFDGRGERSDGRYDASGPNNWRSQGRPVTSAPAPSGPPKLSLQPRSQPAEEIGGPIKRAGEDPFGGASSNADKLKKQAEERLRREQESDRKKQEQLQRIQQQREAKEAAPKDSWRGGPRENTRQEGGRGGRGGRPGNAGRYDNSWGPGASSTAESKPQRAPEMKRGPSKQETDKAEAVANPFALLNNDEDNQ